MTANIWMHDWRPFYPYSAATHHKFISVTCKEIRQRFLGLDELSIRSAERFILTQKECYIPDSIRKSLFYNWQNFLTKQEISIWDKAKNEYKREIPKYKLDKFNVCFGYESIVFFHGLKLCPKSVIKYFENKVFFDVGACYGDSALVFRKHFSPAKIWSFEPSSKNRRIYTEIMIANEISSDAYELIPCGLGNENRTISFCESEGGENSLRNVENADTVVDCRRLDDFCAEKNITGVKLIKADIEGMGLEMLQGAKETICRDRPVLSLSIYHNQDEFFGIYETIKTWNLNYHCIIRLLCPNIGELSLIAWPRELD